VRRLLLCVVALAVAAGARAEWVERSVDGTMGTRIHVELWAGTRATGEADIDAVMREMQRIDFAMSTYKPTSEVSRVNARAARAPLRISRELFDLLGTAVEYSRITDGAFDITYASVGFMYDFHRRLKPTAAQIEATLPAVNYRNLELDPKRRTIHFTRDGVRIDLGGIAIHVTRHRDPAGARHPSRARQRRRRQPHHRRPLRQALDRGHPSPGQQGAGDRPHPAGRHGDLDLGRLRALLR
jgi:thiamine biosynthesis lipoprotein ApbE